MSLPSLRECFGLSDPERCEQLASVTGFSVQRLRDFAENDTATRAEFLALLAGLVTVTEGEEQDPFLVKLEGIVHGRLPREVVLGATARLFARVKQELREEGEDVLRITAKRPQVEDLTERLRKQGERLAELKPRRQEP